MTKADKALQFSPQILVGFAMLFFAYPFLTNTLYQNISFGAGVILMFSAWLAANLLKKEELVESGKWIEQKKVMTAMSACLALGLFMLVYYEAQMPKYNIAMTKKELYRVPPQLNKRQLVELGSECNTYGNTLCSHDVFAKIVKMDPRDYNALGNLAMAQTHLGFHQYAVENFTKVVENGAGTYDIYRFFGDSLMEVGRHQQALQVYKRSLRLNPKQDFLRKKIRNISKSIPKGDK
jgi:tetratricopeptide (TPR) repeat protein